MNIEFDKSFSRCLDKINDSELLSRIESIIIEYENAESIVEIKNTKKLTGFKSYYRTRVGDYRLGFELKDPKKIRLIIFAHRKDIYRTFP
jgi:mRNA interferase RelE/StbE